MKYFENIATQDFKSGQQVCGDTYLCERTPEHTLLVLCDGIGSGIYANIASITCANRLMELFRTNMSFSEACDTVASSMHRARTEDIPFSAFTAVKILCDGSFTVCAYESPEPIVVRRCKAEILKPVFHPAGLEMVGEAYGELDYGDALLVTSDGVTQAGLGRGFTFGIGSEGVAEFVTSNLEKPDDLAEVLRDLNKETFSLSGDRYADDTTSVAMFCREAKQLTIASGPPTARDRDAEYVRTFMESPGVHVVCGSTTTDIITRELGLTAELIMSSTAMGGPPEYYVEGIDLVTEGAIMLSQVYNIIDMDPSEFTGHTAPEKLCCYMRGADVVNFIHGAAINEAHGDIAFKQAGVRPRQATIKLISEKLVGMGKLVLTKTF